MGRYTGEKMIRFRLPPSVKVKGVRYIVKVVRKLKDDDGKECSGLHDSENKILSIDRALRGKERRQTFFHEYFHAYLEECGVREGLDSQLEEVIVEILSRSLEENDFDIRWKPKILS